MENWNKLCRACLHSSNNFTHFLFENVGAATYTFCTSVEVNAEDNLPKALCDPCYKLLVQFSQFKNTCINSQNELSKQLKPGNELLYNKLLFALKLEEIDNTFYNADLTDYSPLALKNEDNSGFKNEDIQKVEDNTNKTEINKDGYNKKFKKKNEEKTTLQPTTVPRGIPYILLTKSNANKTNSMNQPTNHKQNINIQTLFTCNICFKVCTKKEVFEAHNLEHKKRQRTQTKKRFSFTCDTCKQHYTNKKEYEVHCVKHGVLKLKYPCDKCSNRYETWSGLTRHIETHHTITRLGDLKCKKCGRVCKSRHTLLQHMQKYHGQGQRVQAVCHICGTSCVNSSALKRHIETHSENRERRYSCPECGKKFFSRSNLRGHILYFHGVAQYVCDHCKRQFKEKQTLIRHIRTHTGQARYRCEFCQKKFEHKSSFVIHQRIHTGERPFECEFCSNAFVSKRILNDHRRIHTGEKPYKCGVCGHSFSQIGTRNRHVKNHLNQSDKSKVKHT